MPTERRTANGPARAASGVTSWGRDHAPRSERRCGWPTVACQPCGVTASLVAGRSMAVVGDQIGSDGLMLREGNRHSRTTEY
jgi:hypothetical protein